MGTSINDNLCYSKPSLWKGRGTTAVVDEMKTIKTEPLS